MAAPSKRFENRKFHSDTTSKYFLPNDSSEHARLELQHKYFSTILENKLSRAPTSYPSQILDVGCGTGCVTSWLAETFPFATVVGLDISAVPKIREQPANVKYLLGNVLQQNPRDWISGDGEKPFQEESGIFDFIFSRVVISGVSDWEGYIAKQFSLLKPGGWAEFQEPAMVVYDSEDRFVDVWDVYKSDAGLEGFDTRSGEKLEERVRGGGFEDVATEVFAMPLGDKGHPTQELRDFGEWSMKNSIDIAEVATRRGTAGREPGEAERVMERLKAVLGRADGWHMKYYVTYGRKPE